MIIVWMYFCRAKCRFYRIWLFNDDLWCYWLGYYLILAWFTGSGEHSRGSLPSDTSDSDFKRGGFRATAGPRLPFWAPVLLHGSQAPIIRYTRHKQAPLFLLLMFYIWCSAVTRTAPSRNGHVNRCVHGWRSLVWVSTWICPDVGH